MDYKKTRLIFHRSKPCSDDLISRTVLTLLCGLLLLSLFLNPSPLFGKDRSTLRVYTVNYPLAYFAERIGGKYVEVAMPVPPDEDPAYWKPGIDDIVAFQQADLILLNGAGYAKWVLTATLPQSKMVGTSRGFRDRYIRIEGVLAHSHGAEGEHAHEGIAFTTWLDLSLAVQHAKAIADALVRKMPEQRKLFERNAAELEEELEALDREIGEIVSRNQDQPLVGSHPVYQYFARRYGLNMREVHWEPDEAPDRHQWVELEDMLKAHPAEWMIWEGEPMEETVERLQVIGVGSFVFNPCGNVTDEGDFMSVMGQNVTNLNAAFK